MIMDKLRRILLFIWVGMFFCFVSSTEAQNPAKSSEKIINGFGQKVYGEEIGYHSCHPDANKALLIRSLNQDDYIGWKTASASDVKADRVTFAWIAGFASGTAGQDHQYRLYINNEEAFSIHTPMRQRGADWQLTNAAGAELRFQYVKSDGIDDHYGYMFLTVPRNLLNPDGTLDLKVKGDATGSKDWLMTFMYEYRDKVVVTPEEALVKGEGGKAFQRIKLGIDHFKAPQPIQIVYQGKILEKGMLQFGANYFYLKLEEAKSTVTQAITLVVGKDKQVVEFVQEPVKRFSVYILSHSHVDIGYTELQPKVVEKQIQNIEKALDLVDKTSSYPDAAQFRWNCEVLWPVQNYLAQATPEKRKRFFDAVLRGQVGLDGLYSNELLGLCSDEELFLAFAYARELQKEEGVKIESAMISDVPGYSWGIVPAMAFNGVKYFSIGPNTFDRIGHTLSQWGDKPFYWISPSGKEKILFWMNAYGYSTFHGGSLAKTDGTPIFELLRDLNNRKYPYSQVMVRYTIGGDNGHPDEDLADYVKDWNVQYVTPQLKLSLSTPMFKDFEAKYGAELPTYSGDFTPYWEDGAGSSAFETAMNRHSANRMTQASALWAMTKPANYPQEIASKGWENILLYSEHTWGAHNSISEPDIEFVTGQWAIKRDFALQGDTLSKALLQGVLATILSEKGKQESVTVYNTTSWIRDGLVVVPASINMSQGMVVVDEKGHLHPVQQMKDGRFAFVARGIPALGSARYIIKKGRIKQDSDLKASGHKLSNAFYDLTIDDKTGNIIKLIRKSDGQNLASGDGLNAYVYTGSNAENSRSNGVPNIRMGEEGPCVVSLVIESEAPGCQKLTREIRLYAGIDQVEIINTLDKQRVYEKENVRFAFPFNVQEPQTRMDMAWAVVRPEVDQLQGANRNYFTIQRWVDVSNGQKGVTLATPDAPLLEVGGMNGEAWKKGPGQTWAKTSASSSLLYSWVMNNSWHTNYRAYQEGIVTFRYVIAGHDGFEASQAEKLGREASLPLLAVSRGVKLEVPFKLEGDPQIVVTSMVPENGGRDLLVRLYNSGDQPSRVELVTDKSREVRLIQQAGDQGTLVNSNLVLEGYGIRTLLVKAK